MIPCLKVATFSNVRCHLLFFVSYLESSDLYKRHISVTLLKKLLIMRIGNYEIALFILSNINSISDRYFFVNKVIHPV